MPDASSAKDRAPKMAAGTREMKRSTDGGTVKRRTQGTGNPRAPLEERSKDELYNLAEEDDIKGRSRMNKNQLITAIRKKRGNDL